MSDQFVNIISKTIDKHAPLDRMSRKRRKLAGKPWITKGVLTSIRKEIEYFELTSLLVIQWKRVSFGVTRARLQKFSSCPKGFTITLKLVTTKKLANNVENVRYCRINQPVNPQ